MQHRRHGIRRPRLLSAVFATAGLVALALAVGFAKASPSVKAGYKTPSPTTLKISQNAQFISSFQVNVEITLSCTAGSGYFASVDVQQPQGFGFTTFGSGFTSGQCTGRQQKLAVPVYSFFGGWQLGDAVASATACTAACASDTKQIHIVP
jgi:hypothetical protein